MKSGLLWAVMMFLGIGLISACGGGGGGGGASGTVPAGAKTTSQSAHDGTEESVTAGNDATELAHMSNIQFSSLVGAGAGQAGCVSNCTVSMDASGLPAPAAAAPQFKKALSLFKSQARGPNTPDSYVAGCVSGITGTLVNYNAPGQNGCASGDTRLDIDYANGDRVEYTWDCTDLNGCTTTMRVVGGDYSGTTITYSLDWTQFYLDIRTTGRIKYQSIIGYDRCLDANWHMTWAADNSSSLTIDTTTDFINIGRNYRAQSDLTYTMGGDSASQTGYWSLGGNTRWADIEVPQTVFTLCTGATFTENGHVLEYRNMNVREDWNAVPTITSSASGAVVYDDTEIGHFEPGTYGSVNIRWNDGEVTPFDPWENMWSNFMILY